MLRMSVVSFYLIQVLTGDTLSRGSRPSSPRPLPAKPHNTSEIGLSDLLWEFLQLCWDPDGNRRPVVEEVVMRLAEAASNWHISTLSNPIEIDGADPIKRPDIPSNEPSNESPGGFREGLMTPVATSESQGFSSVDGESRTT